MTRNPYTENPDKLHAAISNTELEQPDNGAPGKTESESDFETAEFGARSAAAAAELWTKKELIVAYTIVWLIYFVNAFSSGIISTLTPYVTSSFERHSLTATTQILASLCSGLGVLPFAKILNIWGRAPGYLVMLFFIVIGLVMMAACQTVETYCAAQVFYSVGTNNLTFAITIFIADTSALKNRAFLLAFTSSPYLATVWAYGPAAERVLATIGLRWGFGIWTIVFPVVCAPLWVMFYRVERKAIKLGLLEKDKSDRTFAQNCYYYAREFDLIGMLILVTGLALFLLSFSIYSYQPKEWRSPLIICFIVIGGLLIVAFVLWERYLAPVPYMPWYLIRNRTVFFTFVMVGCIYSGYYVWDSYLYSMLIVVFRESVANATYVGNTYTMGSCFFCLLLGLFFRKYGRVKRVALAFGGPISLLGVGLMLKFRSADSYIGYLVMCLMFIAVAGGTLVICEQLSVMAVSKHKDIPSILAMEYTIALVAGSIGSTVAAAIWTGVFPNRLLRYLPESAQSQFAEIYGSLEVQASYPVGSATRNAIDRSYSETQRLMIIASIALYALAWASILFWQDLDIKKIPHFRRRLAV